jgi:hypothetical protein
MRPLAPHQAQIAKARVICHVPIDEASEAEVHSVLCEAPALKEHSSAPIADAHRWAIDSELWARGAPVTGEGEWGFSCL